MRRTLLCSKCWRINVQQINRYGQHTVKKMTLVQKIPRYDHERSLHPDLSEHDLQEMVKFKTILQLMIYIPPSWYHVVLILKAC